MRSLARGGESLRQYDAAYFMASTDDVEVNTRFAQKERADFPILSDATKTTARAYGVLGLFGVPNRWTFYIDRDGTIAHIDRSVKAASAAEGIVAKLAELGVPAR